MNTIEKLIGSVVINMKYPGRVIADTILLTNDEIPTLQRGLLFIALNKSYVHQLQPIEEVESCLSQHVEDTISEIIDELIQWSELMLKGTTFKGKETIVLLGVFFENMEKKGELPESDDLIEYLTTVYEYFHLITRIFSEHGRIDLIDGMKNCFNHEEQRNFEELIERLNKSNLLNITRE
jgi:hypothetical protein